MRRITPFFPFFVLLVSHFSLAISYPLPPEGSRLVGQACHNHRTAEQYSALRVICRPLRSGAE